MLVFAVSEGHVERDEADAIPDGPVRPIHLGSEVRVEHQFVFGVELDPRAIDLARAGTRSRPVNALARSLSSLCPSAVSATRTNRLRTRAATSLGISDCLLRITNRIGAVHDRSGPRTF